MPDALGVYVTMYKVENEHEFQTSPLDAGGGGRGLQRSKKEQRNLQTAPNTMHIDTHS